MPTPATPKVPMPRLSAGARDDAPLTSYAMRAETFAELLSEAEMMTTAQLPFPVNASVAETAFRLAMPMGKSDTPAPYAAVLRIVANEAGPLNGAN